MSRLFSENAEKKIPETFEECYKLDTITQNLWSWGRALERYGEILFIIILILGTIRALAPLFVSEYETASAVIYIIFNVFKEIIITAIVAVIEYLIYRTIALLIGALADIVRHTRITANIALYTEQNYIYGSKHTSE